MIKPISNKRCAGTKTEATMWFAMRGLNETLDKAGSVLAHCWRPRRRASISRDQRPEDLATRSYANGWRVHVVIVRSRGFVMIVRIRRW